jgi:Acyl-protein synthetase, LuxE
MMEWKGVFSIQNEHEFENWALKIFYFQYENTEVYREYCDLIDRTEPSKLSEIPFLPISFFKTHQVKNKQLPIQLTFKSSGTTGMDRSIHLIQDIEMYRESFRKTYIAQIGHPENQVIFALLPNYLEQGESSLVFMVDDLISMTNNSMSGFLLNEISTIEKRYQMALAENKEVVVFGVSYALLDLAERNIDLSQATIIETGGMKGRRKELTKEELHNELKKGLNTKYIASEYGMTELLSQAYSTTNQLFELPPWMKVRLRETNDPFSDLSKNKTGGINIIDLANAYSCSFIATQDLGRIEDGRLKLMGRFDNADLRGCNMLVQ